jgi:hypothetical protein
MKRTALITGASSGIGYELAKVIAQDGHDLVLVARTKKKLDDLAKELKKEFKVTVTVLPKDLSLPNAAQEVYDELQKASIQIDMLINNAGLGAHGKFTETEVAQDAQMMQVNMVALTELTKLFTPDMIARKWGKIMNVASIASFMSSPSMAVYAATKAYVLSFSEAINEELRGTGVSVTAVCPGVTQTNFFETAHVSQENINRFGNMLVQSAEEVAKSGYQALKANKAVHITGLVNNLSVNSIQWVPRQIRTPMLGFMFSFFGENK